MCMNCNSIYSYVRKNTSTIETKIAVTLNSTYYHPMKIFICYFKISKKNVKPFTNWYNNCQIHTN